MAILASHLASTTKRRTIPFDAQEQDQVPLDT